MVVVSVLGEHRHHDDDEYHCEHDAARHRLFKRGDYSENVNPILVCAVYVAYMIVDAKTTDRYLEVVTCCDIN